MTDKASAGAFWNEHGPWGGDRARKPGDCRPRALRISAASFGKDPDFYDFYRAMQSYRMTFGTDDAQPPGSA